jgi:hypothetical protein
MTAEQSDSFICDNLSLDKAHEMWRKVKILDDLVDGYMS